MWTQRWNIITFHADLTVWHLTHRWSSYICNSVYGLSMTIRRGTRLIYVLSHHTGVVKWNWSVSPIMPCHRKQEKQNNSRECRSLLAWGAKLLCSLVVRQQILLYLWVNRLWLAWVSSFSIKQTLCRHLSSPISLMLYQLMGTSDDLDHPLQSLHALGRACTMPVYDVSSLDALCRSSVKVAKSLASEFSPLKLP